MAEENVKVQFDTPVTEEIREAEANKEIKNRAEAKNDAKIHAIYGKTEPEKQTEIDLAYIIAFCADDKKNIDKMNAKEKAKWYVDNYSTDKGGFATMRKKFAEKFYPNLSFKSIDAGKKALEMFKKISAGK